MVVLGRPVAHRRRPGRSHAAGETAVRGPLGSGPLGEPSAIRAVTGPGASSWSPIACTACTSRVDEVRNTSSAGAPPPYVALDHVSPLQHQRPRDTGQAARAQRRSHDLAVADHEDVRPGRLAELAGRVGEHRLAGPVGRAWASATTFSAYDVVLIPAVAESRCVSTARSRPSTTEARTARGERHDEGRPGCPARSRAGRCRR